MVLLFYTLFQMAYRNLISFHTYELIKNIFFKLSTTNILSKYHQIFKKNSSPSIKSICCFPEVDASSLAALVKIPVVIKTPFSKISEIFPYCHTHTSDLITCSSRINCEKKGPTSEDVKSHQFTHSNKTVI